MQTCYCSLNRSHFLLNVLWLHLSCHFTSCHFPSRPRLDCVRLALATQRKPSASAPVRLKLWFSQGQWKNAGRDFWLRERKMRGKQESVFVLAWRDMRAETLWASHVFSTRKVWQISLDYLDKKMFFFSFLRQKGDGAFLSWSEGELTISRILWHGNRLGEFCYKWVVQQKRNVKNF